MSHFAVLCITQSPRELDTLLAPYDENLEVESFEEDGETYWRNPLAKWDWYAVGGRWPSTLLLKSGTATAQARKGDLALDLMRQRAREDAGAKWDAIDAVVRDLPEATLWATFVERTDEDATRADWDAARRAYLDQPRLVAMKAAYPDVWDLGETFRDYTVLSRDQYTERAQHLAIAGLGLVTAEGWIEPGEMGMFACTTATPETELSYGRSASRIIDAMPDTAWFTIVDCHI